MNEFDASIFASQELRSDGEPEWMPGPEEVARARARMERQGIVQSLGRGPAALQGGFAPGLRQVVPPGETPWLWWVVAALWVALWPAVFALKVSSDGLAWLTWWQAVLLALAHMGALAVPVWLSQRAASSDSLRRRFGQVQTLPQMLALEPSEFEAWTGMLFQLMGYRVANTQDVADHGIDLQVTNDRIHCGLVQCKRYRGTVGEPTVRDLYGTIVHEGADYGWLATTGAVSRQAREWANGKPIELWDGMKLVDLARRFR